MRLITYFTGTDDQTTNRRAMVTTMLGIAVIIGMIVFGSAARANAAAQTDENQSARSQAVQLEEALTENERLNEEVTELKEALAAAEAERDALGERAASAESTAEQLRSELDTLRQEYATSYVLRFRVERNVTFPQDSEILYFTRTVDEETYHRWLEGNIITGSTGFLTVPNDGMLHEWVVVLEDKYITANGS